MTVFYFHLKLTMQHKTADSPYILNFVPPLSGSGNPLMQLTVAVKDLFHIANYPTTAGNPDWLKTNPIPTTTSPVVSALLDAGASVLGKTITDELAYSLNGQNIHYGTPINAKNPALLPGGSSSGSATAVAIGNADIGLGTDTGGSIRVPASYQGLFGLRPTHGVISTKNMVGLAPSFDTVGWMTRDLDTLTKVADVLLPNNIAKLPHTKIRLGYSNNLNKACAQQNSLNTLLAKLTCEPNIQLTELSAELSLTYLQTAAEAFKTLQGAEIWLTHGQWIENQKPVFAADIATRFAWCRTITEEQKLQAVKIQLEFIDKIQHLFTQVDFLLIPTTPGGAPSLTLSDTDLVNYRNQLMSMTCIAGLAGLPQLQIPLHALSTSPMGISILGPKYHDHQLLALATTLLDLM
jgi:amidase